MLCLKHVELATGEDKENGLVSWAKLFLATTWEEVKELALENTVLKEVAESMAHSNTDRQEEYLAQARLDFIRSFGSVYKSGVNEGHREAAAIIAEKDAEINALKAELSLLKKQ